jgi:ElaB/YqjD/DUF883 family membrane-anchored ribosome-binding protein
VKKAPESFAASIFRAARDTIEESLEASKEKVSDTADDLQKEGRKLVKSTRTYVRKNPYSLLFSALAAGVVLGLLVRRR